MINDYEKIISIICNKFDNKISKFDVVNWLDNFKKEDWNKALTVLNAFEYFSKNDIINELDSGLDSIKEKLESEDNVCVLPIGKLGKSGAAMLYYLKKAPSFDSRIFKIIDKDDFSTLPQFNKIILVDDFSGSGGTILEFHKELKEHISPDSSIIALTVAYMRKAYNALDIENIMIYGNERNPVFAKRGSVFGYIPKMKAIRNFCFDYGNVLYDNDRYNDKKSRLHPLGFSNSQALIGFEHSIPNNTLPIIWADKKRIDNDINWIPIFPRRGSLLIQESRRQKKKEHYWMSIALKLNESKDIFNIGEKYSKRNLKLLSIIYLKQRKKGAINICQILGVNLDLYNSIIKEGKEKNLFNEDEELTNQALKILDQIRKKAKFRKSNYISPKIMIEEDLLYIPKSFRGIS